MTLPHAKRRHYIDSIIYIGIDVHKDSYSYCSYLKDKDTFFAEHKSEADSKNAVKYIKSVIKTAGSQEPVLVGYEAGPTGYKLCRDLQKAGFACVVMAPSTIYKPHGVRVKTDRRDARLLAQTLAYKTFKQVVIPSEKIEAMKEFTRVRCSKKRQLKKAKQELLSFLLRMGMIYPERGSYCQSPLVIQYADMAIARIRHKMMSMERKGLHYNVITTAAARELSCFIWGMMTGNISRASV